MGTALRLIVWVALVGGIGGGGWYYQRHLTRAAEVAELQAKADHLEGVVKRLARERRVAEVVVTDQYPDADGTPVTELLFCEYLPDGEPAGEPRAFAVRGETVHVAAKLVKFDRRYVEAGDPRRGESLARFTGVHGGAEPPESARPLAAPADGGDFEAELWARFWELADDPDLRGRYGVRVAHGQTTWTRMRPDVVYTLTLAADGNLSLASAPVPAVLRGRHAAIPTD